MNQASGLHQFCAGEFIQVIDTPSRTRNFGARTPTWTSSPPTAPFVLTPSAEGAYFSPIFDSAAARRDQEAIRAWERFNKREADRNAAAARAVYWEELLQRRLVDPSFVPPPSPAAWGYSPGPEYHQQVRRTDAEQYYRRKFRRDERIAQTQGVPYERPASTVEADYERALRGEIPGIPVQFDVGPLLSTSRQLPEPIVSSVDGFERLVAIFGINGAVYEVPPFFPPARRPLNFPY